jgi:hypothetical protein
VWPEIAQSLLDYFLDLAQAPLQAGHDAVSVIIGLPLNLSRLLIGAIYYCSSALLGRSDQGVVVDSGGSLVLGTLDHVGSSLLRVRHDSLALGEHPARILQLLGKRQSELVDDVEALLCIYQDLRAERDPTGSSHEVLESIQQVQDIHDLPSASPAV